MSSLVRNDTCWAPQHSKSWCELFGMGHYSVRIASWQISILSSAPETDSCHPAGDPLPLPAAVPNASNTPSFPVVVHLKLEPAVPPAPGQPPYPDPPPLAVYFEHDRCVHSCANLTNAVGCGDYNNLGHGPEDCYAHGCCWALPSGPLPGGCFRADQLARPADVCTPAGGAALLRMSSLPAFLQVLQAKNPRPWAELGTGKGYGPQRWSFVGGR